MLTKTLTVHLHIDAASPLSAHSTFYLFTQEMADYGYVKIGEAEMTFVVDPRVAVVSQIASLRKKQSEIQAEAALRASELDQTINNLLCLEA